MSTNLVRSEIAKFLARKQPGALCIRGKWGVGKTYAWNTALKEAVTNNAVALSTYSYVPLFGVNSLDELKFAIFENTTTLEGGLRKADLGTIEGHVKKLGEWRRLTRIAQSLPIVNKFVSNDATRLVAFMSVKEQIICIDDLERRGKNLEVSDVLGLVSYLCEQRSCKVVLILNNVLAVLASVPAAEYKRILKEASGQELRRILSGVFQFDRVSNATPQMLEIAKRARLALREIGAESAINRRRVKRFGVDLDEPRPAEPQLDIDND